MSPLLKTSSEYHLYNYHISSFPISISPQIYIKQLVMYNSLMDVREYNENTYINMNIYEHTFYSSGLPSSSFHL